MSGLKAPRGGGVISQPGGAYNQVFDFDAQGPKEAVLKIF